MPTALLIEMWLLLMKIGANLEELSSLLLIGNEFELAEEVTFCMSNVSTWFQQLDEILGLNIGSIDITNIPLDRLTSKELMSKFQILEESFDLTTINLNQSYQGLSKLRYNLQYVKNSLLTKDPDLILKIKDINENIINLIKLLDSVP